MKPIIGEGKLPRDQLQQSTPSFETARKGLQRSESEPRVFAFPHRQLFHLSESRSSSERGARALARSQEQGPPRPLDFSRLLRVDGGGRCFLGEWRRRGERRGRSGGSCGGRCEFGHVLLHRPPLSLPIAPQLIFASLRRLELPLQGFDPLIFHSLPVAFDGRDGFVSFALDEFELGRESCHLPSQIGSFGRALSEEEDWSGLSVPRRRGRKSCRIFGA